MSQRRSPLSALLVSLTASMLIMSSCSTGPPTRLYVLTSLTRVESVPQAMGRRDVAIGVGPVELPQYVNRLQIVTGDNSPELQSSYSAQWAEPLQDGFTSLSVVVLVGSLQHRLQIVAVHLLFGANRFYLSLLFAQIINLVREGDEQVPR